MRVRTVIAMLMWMLSSSGSWAANVCTIRVEGAIGPATATYICRAIDEATAQKSECLVIQLDTPGGLLDSTKVIIQKFLASQVPVVVFVSPSGAWAGSAGCFITMAADVAVMAPATSIGAAHPVSIGGGGGEAKPEEAMKQKLENFATSYMESIASKRHRNVEWAKASVRESSSVSEERALELNVIDFVAKDLPDLLKQLEGRKVGEKILTTAGASVVAVEMTLRERVFQMVWRPELMYVLMIIVIYGIIGELSNPGAILPGVVGAIALILLLYMAAVLPVNVAGLALVGLAVALFLIDVFAPTHGVLTAGGVVAFFLGSLMMFDRAEPFYRVSLGLIIPATVVTALFFMFIAGAGLKAQFMPARVGVSTMVGMKARALTAIDGNGGKVFVEGEYWSAVSESPVAEGQEVEVVAVEGLCVKVKPKSS